MTRTAYLGSLPALLLTAGLCITSNASAMERMSMSFTDAAPPSYSWPPSGSRDPINMSPPGACSGNGGPQWNYTRSTSGGPDAAGFYEQTFCAGPSLGPTGWSGDGSGFESTGFPAELCAAVTYYFVNGITPGPGGDSHHAFKTWLWHGGVYDGNHRPVAFWSTGSYNPNDSWSVDDQCNGRGRDTTHVCFSIQHNIDHNTAAAYALIPVGEWTSVQWCWRHGPAGTSFVKLWINNTNYGSPTAQDLSVGDWPQDPQGYRNQWFIGYAANQNTILSENLVVRLRDFQMTPGFDPTYSQGRPTAETPAPPSGLRILRLYLDEPFNWGLG